MYSQDKLLLSNFLLTKQAGGGRLLFEMARHAARKAVPGVASKARNLVRGTAGRFQRAGKPQAVSPQYARESVRQPLVSTGAAGGGGGAPLALPAGGGGGRPLALTSGRSTMPEPNAKLIQRSSGSYNKTAPAAPSNIPSGGAATAPPIIDIPGVASAVPSGLSRARAGMGDVLGGLGQAARTGAGAAVSGLATAGRATGQGLLSAGRAGLATAKNPFVQGLAGAALGHGLLSGGQQSPTNIAAPETGAVEAAPAEPTAGVAQNAVTGYMKPTAPAMAAIAPSTIPPAPANAAQPAPAQANSVTAPATPADVDNTDYNVEFNKYMGSNFVPGSRLDRAKMDYLKSLKPRKIELNPANVYNPAYGYGKF